MFLSLIERDTFEFAPRMRDGMSFLSENERSSSFLSQE